MHIPNGVDTNRFFLNRHAEKKNTILFVGRFLKWKGIKYLLAAAKQLPEYEFWFAGCGSMERIIKGSNIKNLGFIEKTETIMQKATLCIFPSYYENAPLVALEALACGKPTITTNTGFSEYIKHMKNGYIIRPRSTQSIAKAIVHLMTNNQLRETLQKNALITARGYSWNTICKKYDDLFETVTTPHYNENVGH